MVCLGVSSADYFILNCPERDSFLPTVTRLAGLESPPFPAKFNIQQRWALIQEKEEKGLRDFSGSTSDDLEERLQVVCLPKLSRGVVYDVKVVGPGYGAYSQYACWVAGSRHHSTRLIVGIPFLVQGHWELLWQNLLCQSEIKTGGRTPEG